ncbi:MAG TPA: hypothetical protein VHM19_14275, partial [Polyangiales bacterium]|nr:hypothetical protein [Polyangiales bacterium]
MDVRSRKCEAERREGLMQTKHASLVLALAALLWTATVHASIPDANGVFHGCYNALTGSVRLVDTQSCNALERAITWSQTGPRGPTGATGAQGPAGATGPRGPAGDSVTGASVNIGNPNCPYGGVALTLTGFTTYVCNGAPGTTG